jgi:release factor glutamine methyltransferase
VDGVRVVARLRAAGCVFAEEEARLLVAAAADGAALDRLVERRVTGLPLEHVLGWAEFCGLRIAVAPGVFVPRRRTAFLVGCAADGAPPGALVVDLCCGSGAVGAALAARIPGARVHAADVDPAAVTCARRNLPGHAVHRGDLYAALPADLCGRVDVLAVNAPYVPTGAIATMPPEARDHEPPVALDGGADGLDVQRRVAAGAAGWLAAGGRLLIETSRAQAPLTVAAVRAGGLDARVLRSDELDATVVSGVRRGPRRRPAGPGAGRPRRAAPPAPPAARPSSP